MTRRFRLPFEDMRRHFVLATTSLFLALNLQAQNPLPGTQALLTDRNLSIEMTQEVDRFFDEELARTVKRRSESWRPQFSDRDAYERSLAPNRARLARIIGVTDTRVPDPQMEYISSTVMPEKVAETDRFVAYAVRWQVFEGEQHELGGYETWRAVSACLEVDASTKILAGLEELFSQLQ